MVLSGNWLRLACINKYLSAPSYKTKTGLLEITSALVPIMAFAQVWIEFLALYYRVLHIEPLLCTDPECGQHADPVWPNGSKLALD